MPLPLAVVAVSVFVGVALAQNATQSNSTSTLAPPYSPTNAAIFQMSSDDEMAFFLEEILSLAQGGGSQTGEVLRIATQMIPSDFESSYSAFYPMAEAINAIAESVDVKKDPVAAREAYFRAATYYRSADFFIITNQSDPRHLSLWKQQLAAFNKAIALLPIPGERFSVPTYSPDIGNYNAIGVLYKAAECDDRKPTVLIGNGYDGSQEELYHSACIEILKRGINCVTYEGPGQPTPRRFQNIGFIPDWWTTISPIVDYLETRPDIDMSRLALAGISFGGVLTPIAASHEPRFSAMITIDGLVNLQTVFLESFGDPLVPLYLAGNVTQYNQVVDYIIANETYDSSLRWVLAQSKWAFDTSSPFDAMTRVGYINASAAMIHNITYPAFIAKGQDDLSTLNQPEILNAMMINNRTNGAALTTYHEFLISLGAGEHCSLGAESQLWTVVMDWLGDIWGVISYDDGVAQF